MKIKTKDFTKEEIKKFEKLEEENVNLERAIELDKYLKQQEGRFISPLRDRAIEGQTTANTLINEKFGISGDMAKELYPKVSRYLQLMREKHMKQMHKFKGDEWIPDYLDRFSKNIKDR